MLDYFDKDSNLTRLDKQFQLIILQNKINDYQLSFGQMEENLPKNRTQAILPFNPCRVLLSTERKQTGGEYINASYIHVRIKFNFISRSDKIDIFRVVIVLMNL
jgi:protein tyrosine phosphatase